MKGNKVVSGWIGWGALPMALMALGLYWLPTYRQSAYLGAFVAARPSVWEYGKLIFWPQVFWWGLGFLVYPRGNKRASCIIQRRERIPARYLYAMGHGVWISVWMFALCLWGLTAGLGAGAWALPGAWAFACLFGQWAGWRVFNKYPAGGAGLAFSLLLVVALGIAFAYWTHLPPDLPVFAAYIG